MKFIFLIATTFIAACSFSSEPVGYELPEPDMSLDPTALVQPNLIYGCGHWFGDAPAAGEKLFVDVAFRRPNLDAEPSDRPSSRHLSALKRHGGEVAYRFHFPAVRAWIAASDIPSLAGDEAIVSVFRVVNARRYDWNANVRYRPPYTFSDIANKYEQLGGRVNYRFDFISSIGGLIPDRSIDALRSDPNVEYVEGSEPYPNC